MYTMNILRAYPMFIVKVILMVFKRFTSSGIFYNKFPHWLK